MELVRTDTFKNIPRVLFEDSADEFYKGDVIDRLYFHDSILNNSPTTMVFEMRDGSKVVGVLWLTVNFVLNALVCRFVSVLPEYRGDISYRIDKFMTALARSFDLDRIYGATQMDTTHWESFGWEVAGTRTIYKEVQ